MNFFKLILILTLLILQSCSKEKKEVSLIKEVNQEKELISNYREAMKILDKGDSFYAAKKFLETELVFPQSDWAAKSALMAAYSYYIQDYYPEAIFNLERYLSTYPKDKNIPYANYLLAICYYEGIVNEKKDLRPLIKAKQQFVFVINSYPNTEFAMDSAFKINLINEILASKEMYLGRHYAKKEKWIPAINRFKNIVNDYDKTVYIEEAIHRLVEIHYQIGLIDESKKYAALLGYNYGSGDWYKETYKIFNKDYKEVKVKKDKKKNNSILRKIKSLSN
ncbi:outer membrane protein assembly factor BamD [Candidatus Pelagibacter sp.]|nr:outer membrane protein assembly factor BamD [Candidatus Pelagibacter sp.]